MDWDSLEGLPLQGPGISSPEAQELVLVCGGRADRDLDRTPPAPAGSFRTPFCCRPKPAGPDGTPSSVSQDALLWRTSNTLKVESRTLAPMLWSRALLTLQEYTFFLCLNSSRAHLKSYQSTENTSASPTQSGSRKIS